MGKEGNGNDRLHDTAKVTVRVNSITANQEKIISNMHEISFTAGNGDVCDALEGSVVDMKEGEEAILRCESSESVVGGLLNIPANLETPIMIHISVLNFEKAKEKWDLNGMERIERGRNRKEVATELFKQGRIRLAAYLYELIADLFINLDFFNVEIRKDAAELRRAANLNRALCMLKLSKMETVKSLCTSVLAEDATNAKALFRRAKALVALKEFPEAIVDLERLQGVEPTNNEGRQLLREAKRLRTQSDARAANTFSKMCAGLGNMPERADRRDDDLVVMPDMEQELAKIAQKHGLPMPNQASAKKVGDQPERTDVSAEVAAISEPSMVDAAEQQESTGIEQMAPKATVMETTAT